MVFSFFKKPSEKMVAKPAVVPRPKETAPGAPSPAAKNNAPPAPGEGSASPNPPAAAGVAAVAEPSLDFTDSEFNRGATDFLVDDAASPIDSDAEEVAILFANGQDPAAREILEYAVRTHRTPPGERLWLMLFDFYRVVGERAAFDALGIEFAHVFEKSPPIWRMNNAKPVAKTKTKAASGSVLFKGELLGENRPAFEALITAMHKSAKLRLDLSKVQRVDDHGCGLLLGVLHQAAREGREIELLGRDGLNKLVHEYVHVGQAENRQCWLLFLELCQLQGQQEAFENAAIDFAVTFEMSPPSWENRRIAPEPAARSVSAEPAEPDEEAFVLQGEVRGERFNDLAAHAERHDVLLIDCTGLTRMDFVSAGVLQNVLVGIRQTGKQIVVRHPNHLVAELFAVVGMRSVANVVLAKH